MISQSEDKNNFKNKDEEQSYYDEQCEKKNTYKKMELQTRQKLIKDYFSQRKMFEPWKVIFENHFTLNYQNFLNQHNNLKEIPSQNVCHKQLLVQLKEEEPKIFNILLHQDLQYLLGSAEFLPYFKTGQNLCKLKVCDICIKSFCPFQFLISLPYQLNEAHFEKLNSLFNNKSLTSQFQQYIYKQNEEAILLKDLADSRYQTYVTKNEVLQLNEDNLLAFENNNRIYYFQLKIKKNQKFTFKNLEDTTTFVVGVPDQDNINQNVYMYQFEDGIDQKKQIKKKLSDFIIEQEYVDNVLLIQIEQCHFEVFVYPNNANIYTLKASDEENLNIFNDLWTDVAYYEKILGLLVYENQQWKLNCMKEINIFYKKVNRYPEHFILSANENIIIRANVGNIKLECREIGKL